jgi:hypothetical protein
MNQQRVISNQHVNLLARKLTITGQKTVTQVDLAEKKYWGSEKSPVNKWDAESSTQRWGSGISSNGKKNEVEISPPRIGI